MKFEGHINEIDLIAKLVELGDQKFTGAIRFENDGIIKILYLKNGDILSASTNDRTDSIDEILLKSGKVTRDHVRQALTRRKENETLGDALLSLGFITKKELVWARRVQVVVIVRSILKWTDGSFTIVSDYLPKREEGTIYSLRQIVLEIVVTDEDREKFDALLQSGDALFRKNIAFEDSYKALALNEEADRVVRLIDGRRSATEIAASSAVEPFSAFKLLNALHILGLLTETNVRHELSPTVPQYDLGFELEEEPKAESPQLLPGVLPDIPMSHDEEEIPPPPMSDDEPEALEPPEAAWSDPLSELTDESVVVEEVQPSENLPVDEALESEAPHASSETPQRRKPAIAAVIAMILLVAAAFGGYSYWARSQRVVEPPPSRPREVASASAVAPSSETTATEMTTTDTTVTAESVAPPVVTQPSTAPPKKVEPRSKPTRIASDTGFKVEKTESGYTVSNLDEKQGKRSTPARPPVSANDPLRQRYDSMAREFATANRGVAFAIQFELVCQTDSVTKALEAGGSSVWFVPINYQGSSCYRVFWGRYDSSSAAQSGIDEIPTSLRGGKPVVIRPAEIIEP